MEGEQEFVIPNSSILFSPSPPRSPRRAHSPLLQTWGDNSPCTNCKDKLGPAAGLASPSNPLALKVNSNIINNNDNSTDIIYNEETLTFNTPYLHSNLNDTYLNNPNNYNLTKQRALSEQIRTYEEIYLADTNYYLREKWVTADGGYASRLAYSIYDPLSDRELTKSDVYSKSPKLNPNIVFNIQQAINKIVHESPLERVILSSILPPEGVSPGQVGLLIPIIHAQYHDNNGDRRIFVRTINIPNQNIAPIIELRAIYPSTPQEESSSFLQITNFRKEFVQTISDFVRLGILNLKYWSVDDRVKQDFCDQWSLNFDRANQIAWVDERKPDWDRLLPAPLVNTLETDGWSQPVWRRSELLADLLESRHSNNLNNSSNNIYWQAWPVYNSWQQTAQAILEAWPEDWSLDNKGNRIYPELRGEGTQVVWVPIPLKMFQDIEFLADVYDNMWSSVQRAKNNPGVYIFYLNDSRQLQSIPRETYRPYKIFQRDDKVFPIGLVMPMYDYETPLSPYMNYTEIQEDIFSIPNQALRLLLTPILTYDHSVPFNIPQTELPCFIVSMDTKDTNYQTNPNWLTNINNWLQGILYNLGHNGGTFTTTQVSNTLHINLYTADGRKINRSECKPFPIDITFLASQPWASNDPRQRLNTIRIGANYISKEEIINTNSKEQFIELDGRTPINNSKYQKWFELGGIAYTEQGGFWIWRRPAEYSLPNNLELMSQGQLLQWRVFSWLSLWEDDYRKVYNILESSELWTTDGLNPGVRISTSGDLIIHSADFNQTIDLVKSMYRLLQNNSIDAQLPQLESYKPASPVVLYSTAVQTNTDDILFQLEVMYDTERGTGQIWLVQGAYRNLGYIGPLPTIDINNHEWVQIMQETLQNRLLELPLIKQLYESSGRIPFEILEVRELVTQLLSELWIASSPSLETDQLQY